jgi:hypothetical protein
MSRVAITGEIARMFLRNFLIDFPIFIFLFSYFIS